jgi:hypothetical protein
MKEWLGLHYEGNIYYEGHHSPTQVLNNCVHPDLGLHVFNASQERHPQISTLPLFAAALPEGEGG